MIGKRQRASLDEALQPSGEQGFFDKSLGIRIFLGVLYVLSLLTFLHFQEVKLEVLELGSKAPRYVVAQVDFAYPDEETTILLRQEAVRDIGRIYFVSDKEIASRQSVFEQYLSEEQGWRQEVKQATFEDMYHAVDLFTTTLARERFTDPRTLKKMRTIDLPTERYYAFTPADPSQAAVLPQEFWERVSNKAFEGSDIPPAAEKFVEEYFSNKAWGLIEDPSSMKAIRDVAQRRVPLVTKHHSAGGRIIDKGEVVSGRHVAMVQSMNKVLQERKNLWHPTTLAGSIILTLLFVAVGGAYLRLNHRSVFYSNKKLFLMLVVMVLTLAIAKGTEYLLLRSTANLTDAVRYPLFVPFAAIILCSLLNARVAVYVSVLLSVVLTLTLAVNGEGFLVINVLASLVAILSTRSLRKRKEVFVVCAKAWACCVLVLVAFHLYAQSFFTISLVNDMVSTFIFMLLTAVVVVGLVPLLESFFRLITEITLMEFMDPTHPILRRLSIEAPGTYQHSIVVGNLAETAAISIGANGLFCRVATLYHDIGKLASPQYFTENQQGGVNIHQLLTPLESAQVIMAHVPEGVAIARKHNLPEPFIDIIKEHHGTTLVYYFYHQEVTRHGGKREEVDELEFRYCGPKPRSKESAIIMIADTLEAASRAMDEATEESVRALVEKLVNEKAIDGQFDNCLLTFEDLEKVKQSMVKSLVAATHTRIKYPARLPPGGTADDPAMPLKEGSV